MQVGSRLQRELLLSNRQTMGHLKPLSVSNSMTSWREQLCSIQLCFKDKTKKVLKGIVGPGDEWKGHCGSSDVKSGLKPFL